MTQPKHCGKPPNCSIPTGNLCLCYCLQCRMAKQRDVTLGDIDAAQTRINAMERRIDALEKGLIGMVANIVANKLVKEKNHDS